MSQNCHSKVNLCKESISPNQIDQTCTKLLTSRVAMTRMRQQFEPKRRTSPMASPANQGQRWHLKITGYGLGLISLLTLLLPVQAGAVPAFARQTGQNCVACHAGGQFPELTPYGRT